MILFHEKLSDLGALLGLTTLRTEERELTLAPHLLPDSLQPTLVLNEVIDKLGSLCISELGLADSRPGEEAPQIWVKVVHLRQWEKGSAGLQE